MDGSDLPKRNLKSRLVVPEEGRGVCFLLMKIIIISKMEQIQFFCHCG